MTAPLSAELEAERRREFVGRERELATLGTLLREDGPRVVHVNGVAGIGKSTLLDRFAEHGRTAGATVLRLDCRAIEPSQPGLLGALAEATGAADASLPSVAAALAGRSGRVVLAFDTYELFWLMDTFIRRELCPALPENVRVLLSGREGPVGAWLTTAGWRRLFSSVSLGPLTQRESLDYLGAAGFAPEAARRVYGVTRGNPLALRVAAGLGASMGIEALEDAASSAVVDHLTHEYLSAATEPGTRAALEAACVLRRTTESILGAMLPGHRAEELFERLSRLPFAEVRRDGLFVHDAVRDAVATRLAVARPERYRSLRAAAWRQLREEVKHATSKTLWRYTADILYLLQKPEIREGFFPSGYQPHAVEPAGAEDSVIVEEVASRHGGPESLTAVRGWWEHHPEAFSVCRDQHGDRAGFCIVLRGDRLSESVLAADPIAAAWRDDMLRNGPPAHSLLIRRLLDRDEGEGNSGSRGAFGLDVKRTYMEMRPNLRYIYLAGVVRQNFDWCDPLGFEEQPALERDLDGVPYKTFRLDMGEGSVDAWLANLVAVELGITPRRAGNVEFDMEAREVRTPAGAAALTALEAKVLALLWERAGRPVSRADLFELGWGEASDATSNVVDAVVLGLRRKLGAEAAVVESVRGVGYRLRP